MISPLPAFRRNLYLPDASLYTSNLPAIALLLRCALSRGSPYRVNDGPVPTVRQQRWFGRAVAVVAETELHAHHRHDHRGQPQPGAEGHAPGQVGGPELGVEQVERLQLDERVEHVQ